MNQLKNVQRGCSMLGTGTVAGLGYHFGDAGLKVTPLAMGIGEMAMMDQLSWFNFGGER